MSWLGEILDRSAAYRRVDNARAVLNPERLEKLARFAEELAAQERADKYVAPTFSRGAWE